jgi:hypothetical protein
MKIKTYNFTKLLKSKDVTFLELNPDAKYFAVINTKAFRRSEAEGLGKYIPQVKTVVFVDGTPDESLALYEIEKDEQNDCK